MQSRSASDLLLHLYCVLLVVGSAVYLRTIVSGDKSGRPSYIPAWFTSDLSSGFTVSADLDECTFRAGTGKDGDDSCSADSARVHFKARMTPGSKQLGSKGIFLVVQTSKDFVRWTQANRPISLPDSLFSRQPDGSLLATTEACLDLPGFTYAVVCASDGPPSKGHNCPEPPCYGTTGPPFGDCIALTSACGATCRTNALEPWNLAGRCNADGHVPLEVIRAFQRSGSIEGTYVLFMVAYTFGLLYFLLMYLPGTGQIQARIPQWSVLLDAYRKGAIKERTGIERAREEKRMLQEITQRNRGAKVGVAPESSGRSSSGAKDGGDELKGSDLVEEAIEEGAENEYDEDSLSVGSHEQVRLLTRAEREAAIHERALEAEQQVEAAALPSSSVGATAIAFSITAGEGVNILIRNLLGKIVANLALAKEWSGVQAVSVVDGIADEGHRIGCYYLVRAMSVVFYECFFPSVALQLGERWLSAMNAHASARDVTTFDKADVFCMLSEDDQARAEIRYLRFIASLFKTLNTFTRPVDLLFDRALSLPFLSKPGYTAASRVIRARLGVAEGTGFDPSPDAVARLLGEESDAAITEVAEAIGVHDHHAASVLLRKILVDLKKGIHAPCSLTELITAPRRRRDSSSKKPEPLMRRRSLTGAPPDANARPALKRLTSSRIAEELISSDPGRVGGARSGEQLTFFSPTFVNEFALTFLGHRPDGDLAPAAPRKHTSAGPSDCCAYLAALTSLTPNDPLGCDAFQEYIAKSLTLEESAYLLRATNKRWLAYDHVETVAVSGDQILSIYAARGRPDKWQSWTKTHHRRTLQQGTWACMVPEDETDEAWWISRRQIALLHRVTDGLAFGHYYADSMDEVGGNVDEFTHHPIASLRLLNVHLGKAGGLNFGLEAIMRTDGVAKPSPSRPYFFGIIDARHTIDERFWLNVLPEYYEVDDVREAVFLNPEVVLCQLPHSYIGVESNVADDVLGLQNSFFFSGMAIFRDRCYGMTSAGTGGIWTIRSPRDVADYFYGRTMIEDTTSSHKYFFKGFCSKYLQPLRGAPALMRAVPKVSANYLEALERWDTGAVQALLSQGLPSLWFYRTLVILVGIGAAIIAPAFTAGTPIAYIVADPFSAANRTHSVLLLYSASVFGLFAFGLPLLSVLAPRTLNWMLRYLIIFFNLTYPLTSIPSVLWLAFPPWIIATAAFPFKWNAVPAVTGSLILKTIELLAVGRMQEGSAELSEESLTRTQQMQLVTVPIKLRAIIKGFKTGWKDLTVKVDNSWWESFGTVGVVRWVRIWLLLIAVTMAVTIVVGIGRLVVVAATAELADFIRVVLPIVYGSALALINLLTVIKPLRYVLRNQSSGVSLRWCEVALQGLLLFGTILLVVNVGFALNVAV